MISEKSLVVELKRLPRLRRIAVNEGKYDVALELDHLIETIEWVLSDED